MSVAVSVEVSEGLVLAADSTMSVQGTMQTPRGEVAGLIKTYGNASKLFRIRDYPVGVLAWGVGLVGYSNTASLVRQYQVNLPRDVDARGSYSVRAIAESMIDHVKAHYEVAFGDHPAQAQPGLGMMICGYSPGEVWPEQWSFQLPSDTEPHRVRPPIDGRPDFGVNWYGLTDAIVRFHLGRDDRAVDILAREFGVTHERIETLLSPLRYEMFFEGMPIQEAIAYAVYLVNLAIGRFRFVVGAPLCGGDVDVAIITCDGFEWVSDTGGG